MHFEPVIVKYVSHPHFISVVLSGNLTMLMVQTLLSNLFVLVTKVSFEVNQIYCEAQGKLNIKIDILFCLRSRPVDPDVVC